MQKLRDKLMGWIGRTSSVSHTTVQLEVQSAFIKDEWIYYLGAKGISSLATLDQVRPPTTKLFFMMRIRLSQPFWVLCRTKQFWCLLWTLSAQPLRTSKPGAFWDYNNHVSITTVTKNIRQSWEQYLACIQVVSVYRRLCRDQICTSASIRPFLTHFRHLIFCFQSGTESACTRTYLVTGSCIMMCMLRLKNFDCLCLHVTICQRQPRFLSSGGPCLPQPLPRKAILWSK